MSLSLVSKIRSCFCWALFICFFPGCTSQLKQAEDLLNRGEASKALQKSEDFLAENPGQIEWIELRRKARLKWIDQSLLQVRLLRLGGNFSQSEELLVEVIHRQNLWNLFPTGPVFATQKEELDHLQRRVLQRVKTSLQKQSPFRAQHEFFRLKSILSQTLGMDTKPLQQAIEEEGQKFCRIQLKKTPAQSFFTRQFLSNVCGFWKMSSIPKLSQLESPFFRDLEVRFQVSHWPLKENDFVVQGLRDAFSKTPWYDPRGQQVLRMQIGGTFDESVRQERRERKASYEVSIPYEYTEVREVSPPPTGAWAFIEVLGILARSDRVIINNGDGTETLRETRYRKEDRTYRYQVEEFTQTMSLNLLNRVSLGETPIEFPYAEIFQKVSDEHQVNFPSAGVRPQQRVLVKSTDWVPGSMVGLARVLDEKLRDQWERSFCLETFKTLEQSHRCLFGTRSGLSSTQSQILFENYQLDFVEVRYLLEAIDQNRAQYRGSL